ncbi:MAG: hypothetical protein MUC92_03320 [Fimbriimonadaceae bacterium]|jgi:hypothetical protein|nr:hypothetical protein [Fimbriimonadaceae bacterium]
MVSLRLIAVILTLLALIGISPAQRSEPMPWEQVVSFLNTDKDPAVNLSNVMLYLGFDITDAEGKVIQKSQEDNAHRIQVSQAEIEAFALMHKQGDLIRYDDLVALYQPAVEIIGMKSRLGDIMNVWYLNAGLNRAASDLVWGMGYLNEGVESNFMDGSPEQGDEPHMITPAAALVWMKVVGSELVATLNRQSSGSLFSASLLPGLSQEYGGLKLLESVSVPDPIPAQPTRPDQVKEAVKQIEDTPAVLACNVAISLEFAKIGPQMRRTSTTTPGGRQEFDLQVNYTAEISKALQTFLKYKGVQTLKISETRPVSAFDVFWRISSTNEAVRIASPKAITTIQGGRGTFIAEGSPQARNLATPKPYRQSYDAHFLVGVASENVPSVAIMASEGGPIWGRAPKGMRWTKSRETSQIFTDVIEGGNVVTISFNMAEHLIPRKGMNQSWNFSGIFVLSDQAAKVNDPLVTYEEMNRVMRESLKDVPASMRADMLKQIADMNKDADPNPPIEIRNGKEVVRGSSIESFSSFGQTGGCEQVTPVSRSFTEKGLPSKTKRSSYSIIIDRRTQRMEVNLGIAFDVTINNRNSVGADTKRSKGTREASWNRWGANRNKGAESRDLGNRFEGPFTVTKDNWFTTYTMSIPRPESENPNWSGSGNFTILVQIPNPSLK